MVDLLTIEHPGFAPISGSKVRRVLAVQVTTSGRKTVKTEPLPSGDRKSEAQTQGYENLKYAVTGIHFDPDTPNHLTWGDILILYKHRFDGTNPAIMKVSYGISTARELTDSDGNTEIPVILESFSFPVNVSESRGGYMPVGTLTFTETFVDE